MYPKAIALMMLLLIGHLTVPTHASESIKTSGKLRLALDKVSFLSGDKYNLTFFRDGAKAGDITKIQYADTPLINTLKFFFISKEYAGNPSARHDKVSVFQVTKLKSGFRITTVVEKTFRHLKSQKFVHLADYKTVLTAFDDGRIHIAYTVIPLKSVAVKLFFYNIRLPLSAAGRKITINNQKTLTLPSKATSIEHKYVVLSPGVQNLSMDFPSDSQRGKIKIAFSSNNNVTMFQAGFFNHTTLQIKSPQVGKTHMTGNKPISFDLDIFIKPRKLKKVTSQSNIVLQEKPGYQRLYKSQFGVGFVQVGSPGKTGTNNFAENDQAVKFFKEAGIPYFRFGALYPLLGFNKGYWSKTPMKTDLVYPYDGADLTIQDFTKNQIKAIREKLDGALQISLGPYNPAWMKHIAGKKIQFHAVTDNQAWAKFASKLVKYASENDWNVKVWQIWNEPDTGNWWAGGTFDQYIDFYNIVTKAVKKSDPSALISGPVGTGMVVYNTLLAERFLSGIKGSPLDLYDWHHYGELENIKPNILKIRKLLKKYGREKTGLYISELGTGNGTSHYLMDGVVYIARAWKRLLEEDVRYIDYWNLSSFILDRGLLDTKTNRPVRMYYLFKMMNVYARMYDSVLIRPPVTPKGLEVIAVKNKLHYAYLFIKTDAIQKIDVNIDYANLNSKKVKAYSLRHDRMGKMIKVPYSKEKNTLHYSFSDREVLLLKFIR